MGMNEVLRQATHQMIKDDLAKCKTEQEKLDLIARANACGVLVFNEDWEAMKLEDFTNEEN